MQAIIEDQAVVTFDSVALYIVGGSITLEFFDNRYGEPVFSLSFPNAKAAVKCLNEISNLFKLWKDISRIYISKEFEVTKVF